jgi:hypothetical protein
MSHSPSCSYHTAALGAKCTDLKLELDQHSPMDFGLYLVGSNWAGPHLDMDIARHYVQYYWTDFGPKHWTIQYPMDT